MSKTPPLSPREERRMGLSNGGENGNGNLSPRNRIPSKDKDREVKDKDKEKVKDLFTLRIKEDMKREKKVKKELEKLRDKQDKKERKKRDKSIKKSYPNLGRRGSTPGGYGTSHPASGGKDGGPPTGMVIRISNPLFGMGEEVKKLNEGPISPRNLRSLSPRTPSDKDEATSPQDGVAGADPSPRKGVSFNDTIIPPISQPSATITSSTSKDKNDIDDKIPNGTSKATESSQANDGPKPAPLSKSDDITWKRQALLGKGVYRPLTPTTPPNNNTDDDEEKNRLRRSLTGNSISTPTLPLLTTLGDHKDLNPNNNDSTPSTNQSDDSASGGDRRGRASSVGASAKAKRPHSMNVNVNKTLAGKTEFV